MKASLKEREPGLEERADRQAAEIREPRAENEQLKSESREHMRASFLKYNKALREGREKAEWKDESADAGSVWTSPASKYQAKAIVVAALTRACASLMKSDGGAAKYEASARKRADLLNGLKEGFLRPKNSSI